VNGMNVGLETPCLGAMGQPYILRGCVQWVMGAT
jgi:hypothetical protein